MTDLSLLRVSLTKHGGHKVADLLKSFPADQILGNIDGTYRDINIDRAQTLNNLSTNEQGQIPQLWNEARQLGDRYIDSLVLLAIVFSHHQLITAMSGSKTELMMGRVVRGELIDGKAYTNLAHILEELGFSVVHAYEFVSYDLRPIFALEGLQRLANELFALKLEAAGWDRSGDVVDECIRQGFHEALSIPEEEFRKWLRFLPIDPYGRRKVREADSPFMFKPGHNPRSEDVRRRKSASRTVAAQQNHNRIQSQLYEYLIEKYGPNNVSTENPCGVGSVDVVVHEEGRFIFYEIKTAESDRTCIREALGQLLEYAYWVKGTIIRELVVVSLNSLSMQGSEYINKLREEFGLPIGYKIFDLDTGEFKPPPSDQGELFKY